MDASSKPAGRFSIRNIPNELTLVAAFATAILGVVATGAAISSAIPNPSALLFAAAYGGPAALAFGVYWALSRRL